MKTKDHQSVRNRSTHGFVAYLNPVNNEPRVVCDMCGSHLYDYELNEYDSLFETIYLTYRLELTRRFQIGKNQSDKRKLQKRIRFETNINGFPDKSRPIKEE